ncbi:xylose isomerase [Bombiscardovia nodaiensis]|uniref:Xylose isomerase n=1 Tax=Bombiscardovia nodaiensis TaxID=2932181 RepID=A0ABM8B5S0_9BIFI|nr:xylose isomerase [Bombiscardovia nodaiensis]
MINVAVRGHDVPNAETFEGLGAQMEAYGVHSVQLSLPALYPQIAGASQINPGMGQYCARTLAQHQVSIAVLGCYINMIHPDLALREQLLLKFEAYLRNARAFNAPIVASETGSVRPVPNVRTQENFTDEAYAQARDVIARLVAYGEQMGVTVGIEPGINHPIYSVERTRQLIDDIRSPYLGIVFDSTSLVSASNYRQQLDYAQRGFDLFADKIVAVHVRDYTIVPGQEQVQPCNNGEGLMPVEGVLNLVQQYRPMVAVVFEETKGPAIARVVKRYAGY